MPIRLRVERRTKCVDVRSFQPQSRGCLMAAEAGQMRFASRKRLVQVEPGERPGGTVSRAFRLVQGNQHSRFFELFGNAAGHNANDAGMPFGMR